MRNSYTILTLSLIFIAFTGYSQSPPPINQPQTSPRAEVIQTIGITEVSIEYGRPASRGRDIIGALVPYDQIWRAGANENTRISFDRSIILGGKSIPAGIYSLHMIPGKDNWTIIVNKDHESWGSYFYAEANDVVRFTAKMSEPKQAQERLTYGFENITADGADIYLEWTDFRIAFPLKVNTQELMVDYLEDEYLKNIAGFFWQGFNGAANYTLANDIALDKGLEWAETSISMNKNFVNMSTKSLILRKQDKVKEADKLIMEAMPMATEAGMNAYGYGLLYNIEDVDAAIKVFQKNVKDYPESWNVHDSLAEAFQTKGNKKEAIKYYEKALSMAPEQQKQRIKSTIESLKS